jgi:hypothetical protein
MFNFYDSPDEYRTKWTSAFLWQNRNRRKSVLHKILKNWYYNRNVPRKLLSYKVNITDKRTNILNKEKGVLITPTSSSIYQQVYRLSTLSMQVFSSALGLHCLGYPFPTPFSRRNPQERIEPYLSSYTCVCVCVCCPGFVVEESNCVGLRWVWNRCFYWSSGAFSNCWQEN